MLRPMAPPPQRTVADLLARYDAGRPLAEASTLPSAFYTDPEVFELERATTFSRNWQLVARADQLSAPGCYVTAEVAGEPVVVVRGADQVLRGFFNVCRHHAAAIMTDHAGQVPHLRCPYHGWTYALDGALRGTPDLVGVCNFTREENSLVPVDVDVWEGLVFVRLERGGPMVGESLGRALVDEMAALDLGALRYQEGRLYVVHCNWKVFVDNYLDGGYHVPHLHHGLDSVLDYKSYTIELGPRHCLQSSPMVSTAAAPDIAAVRKGDRAHYYWLHPNTMINRYQGQMDVNIVRPIAVDRTEVLFWFFFEEVMGPEAQARNQASIEVADRIQLEDLDICASVQRGLRSRAYDTGRLSVRREAGEHLFHRLLAAELGAA